MGGLTTLVAAAQGGDQKAFSELVVRFQDTAYATAYGWLRNRSLAEEAAQDAFMEAFISLPRLHEPDAFLAWFRTIVFHCCTRLTRGKQLQAVPLEEAAEALMDTPDPAEEHEMQDFVRNAVEELPEHARMVVSLFYIAGYSQAEIAAFLEVPVGTVKSRMHDARRRLKERMMGMVEEYLQGQRPSKDDRFARRVQQSLILFSANSRFYAMHPDGSDIRPLTGPGTYTDIQWFPDGRILYGEGRIVDGMMAARHYTMKPDGSGKQAFGPDYVAGSSRISPDGNRIAFVSHKDRPGLFPEFNRAEVYVMESDGSNVIRLTNNLVEDSAPTWTPDGRILFCRDVSGNATRHQLFTINADGSGETNYPPGGPETFADYAVFSPDGMRIAFTLYDGQADDLWVMEADGSKQVRLTDLGKRFSAAPSWSPDGRQIVFVAGHQLYIVNADGSSGLRPEPVTTGLKGVNAPVWGRGGGR